MYKLKKDLSKISYTNIQDISQTSVVIRTCLNVAADNTGFVTERARLDESFPFIEEMTKKAKSVVLMAHFGRPKKKSKEHSFWNVAQLLQDEFSKRNSDIELELIESLDSKTIKRIQAQDNSEGEKKVFLLENIRFFPGEESEDPKTRMDFAKILASLGDVFIHDAFADYREAASTYDIAKILPSYIGPTLQKEVEALSKFTNPQRPYIAVLGGAKLSEKLDALKALAVSADKVFVGGAMAYTLMKAKGMEVGKSLIENDKLVVAEEILKSFPDKIVLPDDHLVAREFKEKASYSYTDGVDIPVESLGIDIGWKTIRRFRTEISNARSVVWNGPMGVFEWIHAGVGTKELGDSFAQNVEGYILAGGGDSIAAIDKFNIKGIDHVSTGGGAMLAFLAYDKFPILDVIFEQAR